MDKDTLIILIITAILLFVWVPAFIISVHKVLRKDKKRSYKDQSTKK